MLGIIIGLVLLMYLAYRGMSIIWVAPIAALVVAFSGGLELLPAYTGTYMAGLVGFAQAWFPAFLLGAIFGKVMDESGAARSVAYWITKLIGTKFAIAAVVAACAILTYGGVSLFVVVFAIYPLAVALYREANISRKLIPGAIALGSFTFTMTALPGTPQIQNLIPMQYFGTTPAAAPIMGIAAAIVMCGGGLAWLTYRQKKLTVAGDVFTEPDTKVSEVDVATLPNPLLSSIPLFLVIIILNVFTKELPAAQQVIPPLVVGIFAAILINIKRLPKLIETINAGAAGSVLAIINTSAAVGFGAVVRAVPGFETLTEMVLGIKGNPLISEAVAVNILAGATGSASGGLGIALAALGDKYVELAATANIPLEAFHRVASLSSGGLDTLPHNGAVLTLLAVCAMTHKDSYKDIFMVGTAIPIVSVIVAIIFASIGLV
ncbi:GntP family permease [Alkaliphilus peptidifermentans]|uniref:H+/gluconate symporter n=1 Tax=Alkaliphilus peptidifermentans DSM 18978 TaxID=1120976 RepID=A0A1G5KHR1_9FIRM|nr:GntP family permease [Alkaliphilus peptidifermentans]SCY99620.1 H+/gluconate symporter [Alkaliphilus peptidifermentans DSM 18978]